MSLTRSTSGHLALVAWPAVIKLEGEDELIYIGSGQAWARDAELHAGRYSEDDYLLDSRGCKYQLADRGDGVLLPAYTGGEIPLQSFTRLLRAHASAAGQCCVEKIVTGSVAEGIGLVRSLGDP